ncbi:hypothetical protein SLE2022_166070 [Rubroshorea leprosula]
MVRAPAELHYGTNYNFHIMILQIIEAGIPGSKCKCTSITSQVRGTKRSGNFDRILVLPVLLLTPGHFSVLCAATTVITSFG